MEGAETIVDGVSRREEEDTDEVVGTTTDGLIVEVVIKVVTVVGEVVSVVRREGIGCSSQTACIGWS